MLTSWDRFKGVSVLEFFLENPTTAVHVRELARLLKVSPLTANTYLTAYWKDGILSRERMGNSVFYRLVENFSTQALKRASTLISLMRSKFVDRVLAENPATTSIILYGTRASGGYDEKSDYDFLIFSKDKTLPKKAISTLPREASVRVLTLNEWRKSDESFRKSVQNNHVVLYGSGLVV